MKISIITATYNSADTITDTLKSVQDQNYADIEHIIIDGCSKDQTLEIVQKYLHVSHILSEKDKGIYDAMNKGVSRASGEVIGILNSDDFYENKEVVASVAAFFQNDPELDCLYADLAYVDKNNIHKITRKWTSGPYDRSSFLNGWMPPHPTFFVRKRVYEQYGDFNLSLKTAADYELMLRFLYRYECKCSYLPQTIIKMRAGGASNHNLKARIQANTQDRLAWEINGLKPRFYTLYLKPLRKISQYF